MKEISIRLSVSQSSFNIRGEYIFVLRLALLVHMMLDEIKNQVR